MLIKKIIHFLIAITKKKVKLHFGAPQRSRIVVYDEVGSNILLQSLSLKVKHTILPVRNEIIYIHPLIFFYTLYWTFKKKEHPRFSYELACLKLMNPKLVLTYIDNNQFFSRFEKYIPSHYISFQNGLRSKVCFNDIKKIQTYFSFGQQTIKLLEKSQINTSKTKNIGSIRASYFFNTINTKFTQKFDICLISSYQPGMELEGYAEKDLNKTKLSEITRKTCHFLSRYLKEKPKISLAIAFWSSGELALSEEKFYRQFFKENAFYCHNNQKMFSSYKLCNSSKLSISYNSTLSYECIAHGLKGFVFNHPEENIFNIDQLSSSEIRLKSLDYNEFRNKINFLLKCKTEDFLRSIKKDIDHIISSTDANVVASEYIHELIKKI